jgi:PAS domain S-box-containing protein
MEELAEKTSPGNETESFFRTLVEMMPQMVWTKDATGRNDYCNARFLEYMNISRDEFLDGAWILAHPDDVARVKAVWYTSAESGTSFETEMRLRPKHARAYHWYLVRAVPHRDASGTIDKWFGTTTDIDAQQRAFAALDFLANSSTRLAGVENVHSVLDRLARASLEGLADISIFDLEEDGQFVRLALSSTNVPQSHVEIVNAFGAPKPGEGHPIARAMDTGETIHIAYVDEAFVERAIAGPARQEAWRILDIRSIVCAPMVIPGRVKGGLTLVRLGSSVPFEASEVRVVEEVARRAALAIDAIRLGERDQRNARDLQAFADMGESVTGAVGLSDTLDAAMRAIVPGRADWAFINLMDDRNELRLAAVRHPDEVTSRSIAAHVGTRYRGADGAESVTLEVLRTHSPVFCEKTDYANAERVVNPPLLDAIWRTGCESFVVVPLFSGSAVRGTVHLLMGSKERAFVRSDVEFFQEFARRLAPAIANAELFERESRVARSFQKAALPAALPDVPGLSFDAIYEAGKAEALVGGDWYDAFGIADGRIVISIGDVAGSGLSAAVTMASVRQAIRGAANVLADPSVMLAAADRALEDAEDRFVTAFVGVIDPAASSLAYRSAGHPPPLLALRDGRVIELMCDGTPLGLNVTDPSPARTTEIPHGSLLVLYTDGLIEATRDILDGENRLRAVLRGVDVRTASRPAQHIHDAVLVHGSRDDVAILTIDVL